LSDLILFEQVKKLVNKTWSLNREKYPEIYPELTDETIYEIISQYTKDPVANKSGMITGLPYCIACGQQSEPFGDVVNSRTRIEFFCDDFCHAAAHGG
jgi:hypothetical protein